MVPEFYKDRDIFITGGSGVVGKALMEKLLRSCDVRKIFVLMRPKRGASIEERLDALKQEAIFRRLKSEKPNEFDDKVVPIPGDVELPMLGICPASLKLMENVSLIFHGAATVRFTEPLKNAIKINVGGTLEALRVAETLEHLEVFMHVSTFFSNPYLKYVETKWYEAPMNWKFCLDLSRRNDVPDETLEVLTRKLITGFPNTYCFTKNLAESLVNDYRGKLPVVIYRPAIVVCATEEPEPGFPPGLTNPMAMFDLAGAGILKALYINKNVFSDVVYLDIVVKCMIYYARKTAHIYAKGRPPTIPVLHTSSHTHSEYSLSDVLDVYRKFKNWEDAALERSFLIPGVKCTGSRLLYMFLVMLKQLLPALLADMLLLLRGRNPALMATQRKVFILTAMVTPFLFNQYESSGISYYEEMLTELKGSDFDIGVAQNMNTEYFFFRLTHENSYRVREICFKEDPSTLPRSRRILKVKIYFYRAVKLLLAFKLWDMISPLLNWEWHVDNDNMTNLTTQYLMYNNTALSCSQICGVDRT